VRDREYRPVLVELGQQLLENLVYRYRRHEERLRVLDDPADPFSDIAPDEVFEPTR
jgi:hypothetical protein